MSKNILESVGTLTPSRANQETSTVAKMARAGRRALLTKPRPWTPLAFFVADWAARIVALSRPTHSTLHDVANMADLFLKVGGMAALTIWFGRTTRTRVPDRIRAVVMIVLGLSTVGDLLTQLPIAFYFGVLVFAVAHLSLIAVIDLDDLQKRRGPPDMPNGPRRWIVWIVVIVEAGAFVAFFGGSPLGCETWSNSLLIGGYIIASSAAIVVFGMAAHVAPDADRPALHLVITALLLLALADIGLLIRSLVTSSNASCVQADGRRLPGLAVAALVLYHVGQCLFAQSMSKGLGKPVTEHVEIPAQDTN